MSEEFFKRPILNSPYEYPAHHWELVELPTQNIQKQHHRAGFIDPIHNATKRKVDQGT